MDAFLAHKDAQVVALCDVDDRAYVKSRPKVQGDVDLEKDFRKLLDWEENNIKQNASSKIGVENSLAIWLTGQLF